MVQKMAEMENSDSEEEKNNFGSGVFDPFNLGTGATNPTTANLTSPTSKTSGTFEPLPSQPWDPFGINNGPTTTSDPFGSAPMTTTAPVTASKSDPFGSTPFDPFGTGTSNQPVRSNSAPFDPFAMGGPVNTIRPLTPSHANTGPSYDEKKKNIQQLLAADPKPTGTNALFNSTPLSPTPMMGGGNTMGSTPFGTAPTGMGQPNFATFPNNMGNGTNPMGAPVVNNQMTNNPFFTPAPQTNPTTTSNYNPFG